MRRLSRLSLVLTAALWVTTGGCSRPGVGKITGTVTLDGEPLADAIVQFWPRKDPRLAMLFDRTLIDGRFDLTPDPRTEMVAKPGPYVVTVSKFIDTQDNAVVKLGDGIPMPLHLVGQPGRLKSVVPEHYQDKNRSPLSVDVKKGDNHFDIEVSSAKK